MDTGNKLMDIRSVVLGGRIFMKRSSLSEDKALRAYLDGGVEAIIDMHVYEVLGDAFKGPLEVVGAQPKVQVWEGKADSVERDYRVSTADCDLTVEVAVQIREGDENLLVAFVKVYMSDRNESLSTAQKKYIENLLMNYRDSL